jgi:hypothetical protein
MHAEDILRHFDVFEHAQPKPFLGGLLLAEIAFSPREFSRGRD